MYDSRCRNPFSVVPARQDDDDESAPQNAAAYAGCFALASIWPIASTTASNVSRVEAWRAL
jgi:hypothetical protein